MKRKYEVIEGRRVSLWWSRNCADQWTLVDLDSLDQRGMVAYLSMSDDPFHPQGVGMTGEMPLYRVQYRGRGGAFDRRARFTELNPDCQQCVRQFLAVDLPEHTVAVVKETAC